MTTTDTLTTAARASVLIAPDPQTGRRPADPLRKVVPDDLMATDAEGFARIVTATDAIVGYEVDTNDRTGDPVCRIRAALRRWAMANPTATPTPPPVLIEWTTYREETYRAEIPAAEWASMQELGTTADELANYEGDGAILTTYATTDREATEVAA